MVLGVTESNFELVVGKKGTGRTRYGHVELINSIQEGKKGIFITNDISEKIVMRVINNLVGGNTELFEYVTGNLHIIKLEDTWSVDKESDRKELIKLVEENARKNSNEEIVVYVDIVGKAKKESYKDLYEGILKVVNIVKEYSTVVLLEDGKKTADDVKATVKEWLGNVKIVETLGVVQIGDHKGELKTRVVK